MQIIIVLLFSGFVLIIIEGVSSLGISLYRLFSYVPPPPISQYDELTGWTGTPGVYVPDMYGPGKYVKTNSLGFRNDREIELTLSDKGIRIICSGDSFTYGEGVANNHAWCNRMPELDNRLETANLAQPGYGVDQMYLRYMRDGVVLQRSIHIFAFIIGDLVRMGYPDQHQYGKPVLQIEKDGLVAVNVPVPRHRWTASRSITRADFRSIELAKGVFTRLLEENDDGTEHANSIEPVASRVFQAIQQQDEKNNVVTVFVLLPTERDIGKNHSWRRWTAKTMDSLGLHYIDITNDLRAVPAGLAASYFIPPRRPAEGHYTEAGNKWVSETLHRQISKIPQISTIFSDKLNNSGTGGDHHHQ